MGVGALLGAEAREIATKSKIRVQLHAADETAHVCDTVTATGSSLSMC